MTLPFFLLFVFSDELDRIFHLYFLVIPLIALPVLLNILALFWLVFRNLFRKRFKRALSALAAPVLAALPLIAFYVMGITPMWVSFQFARGHYENEIEQVAQRPRLLAFEWGETGGAAAVNVFYILVYDESDQINMPSSDRSAEWTEIANQNLYLRSILTGDGSPYVEQMGGHFYMVIETYQ
jgi:hypothetical protein